MAQYVFTCPLVGCNKMMTADALSSEEAANELTKQAEQHLRDAHPDVQKTHEEVMGDIRSNMVQQGE